MERGFVTDQDEVLTVAEDGRDVAETEWLPLKQLLRSVSEPSQRPTSLNPGRPDWTRLNVCMRFVNNRGVFMATNRGAGPGFLPLFGLAAWLVSPGEKQRSAFFATDDASSVPALALQLRSSFGLDATGLLSTP